MDMTRFWTGLNDTGSVKNTLDSPVMIVRVKA